MTDHLVIDGVPGYDGRYQFDLVASAFTTREWGWIKRYSGYLPLTFTDGWKDADAELMAVFAIIALVRNQKIDRDQVSQAWERFGDAPGILTVRLELQNEEEEETLPPPSAPSSSENTSFSGPGSRTSSERSAPIPAATGTPASATSVSLPAR